MNTTDNQKAINDFIDWVVEISECVNSNEWRGEDVMGIFFNEFNRYKKKSEAGQVFTPEHITDFMYKILDVNKDDYVLDATCGSGGFLSLLVYPDTNITCSPFFSAKIRLSGSMVRLSVRRR